MIIGQFVHMCSLMFIFVHLFRNIFPELIQNNEWPMFILYNEQKNERNKRNEHKNEQMTFVQFVHFHETSNKTNIL